jgi:pyruvate-formate lyase-activating enzyme
VTSVLDTTPIRSATRVTGGRLGSRPSETVGRTTRSRNGRLARYPRDARSKHAGRIPPWARAIAGLVARLYLRRPEMAEPIAIRYRTLRALVGGFLDELAYRLGALRAPVLLSANLELTNRCNLRCTFCPTADGRMARARGFMDDALFRRSLDGAGRLQFALLFQWGEPLLHPRFVELAKDAAARGIRTLVTTNGTLLDDRRIAGLLEAGIDRVTVSVDGDEHTHEAVRGVPLADTAAAIDRLVAARDAAGSATAIDVSMVVAPETEAGVDAFLATFSGAVDRVQTIPLLVRGERRSRCREPWRGGLVVLQDGRCTVCCVDHDGELSVGDARTEDLRSIWNGPRLRALRHAHVTGELPPICAGCSEYPTDAAAPRFSPARPATARADRAARSDLDARGQRVRSEADGPS